MQRKALVFGLLMLFLCSLSAQEKISLWKGYDVRYGSQVVLKSFIADDNDTGLAVIVCPGGSYYWLDKGNEGDVVANWLQQQGISAFVLHYRTAGVGAFLFGRRGLKQGRQHPDMITDAQRALQWVREHAEEYHVDPDKVGMMGFSAGGHLVMSVACFNKTNFLETNGVETNTSLKPAFVAPIYPVVTMCEPYVHQRSRCALLGDNRQNDKVMIDSLSLECHIPADCPPVFLVNCIDDPVVEYHNSILLDSALTANHVNHRYFQYSTGGHGFGANDKEGSSESRQWKTEFLNWLGELGLRESEKRINNNSTNALHSTKLIQQSKIQQ